MVERDPSSRAATNQSRNGTVATVDHPPVDDGGLPSDPEASLEKLTRAEARFGERGKYLGANYFVTRWQSAAATARAIALHDGTGDAVITQAAPSAPSTTAPASGVTPGAPGTGTIR